MGRGLCLGCPPEAVISAGFRAQGAHTWTSLRSRALWESRCMGRRRRPSPSLTQGRSAWKPVAETLVITVAIQTRRLSPDLWGNPGPAAPRSRSGASRGQRIGGPGTAKQAPYGQSPRPRSSVPDPAMRGTPAPSVHLCPFQGKLIPRSPKSVAASPNAGLTGVARIPGRRVGGASVRKMRTRPLQVSAPREASGRESWFTLEIFGGMRD